MQWLLCGSTKKKRTVLSKMDDTKPITITRIGSSLLCVEFSNIFSLCRSCCKERAFLLFRINIRRALQKCILFCHGLHLFNCIKLCHLCALSFQYASLPCQSIHIPHMYIIHRTLSLWDIVDKIQNLVA